MQYLNLYQATIAYREYNSAGVNTLFLVHGNSNSSALWKKQVVSPLLCDYRIITIDLPGHGGSVLHGDPAEVFSVKAFGALLAEVVRALEPDRPWAIAGFSLGGNVVAEMLAHDVSPGAVILVGAGLVGSGIDSNRYTMVPVVDEVLFAGREASDEAVDRYLELACFSEDIADIQELKRDFYATAPEFRRAFTRSVARGEFSDEVKLMKELRVPVLGVFGADDMVISSGMLDDTGIGLWKGGVQVIEAASHTVMLDRPQAFNLLVAEFLEEVWG